MISQLGQIDCETNSPTLSHVDSLIDDIVDRVKQQLARSNCDQQSSPGKILSVVNRFLFEEMAFISTNSYGNYLIEKV